MRAQVSIFAIRKINSVFRQELHGGGCLRLVFHELFVKSVIITQPLQNVLERVSNRFQRSWGENESRFVALPLDLGSTVLRRWAGNELDSMQQIFLKFSSAFRKHEESMLYSRAGIIGILTILLAALATSLISRVVCHDHQTKIERMNKFERSWFLHRAPPRKRTTLCRSDETRARPQERCGIFIFRLERTQEWVESKQVTPWFPAP